MSTTDLRAAMRSSVLTFSKCVTLAVLGTALLGAAPCPTDTAANYVLNFGFGKAVCTIDATSPAGNAVQLTISQFTFVDLGVGPTAPQILVTPVADVHGIGLAFTPNGIPWAATFFHRSDVGLLYIATATKTSADWPGIDRLYAEVNGSVTPPAVDVLTEIYCPGGSTLPPDQTCPGGNGTVLSRLIGPSTPGSGTSIVFFPPYFTVGVNGNCSTKDPTTGNPVCIYPSIALSKDMDANALAGGAAAITRVVNQVGRPVGQTCNCSS